LEGLIPRSLLITVRLALILDFKGPIGVLRFGR